MKSLRIGLIAAVVGLLLIIAGITAWLALDQGRAAHVRDIVIALVGITMVVANVLLVLLLVVLVLRTNALFDFVQHRLNPLFQRANEIADRVQVTTNIVSENVANPAIQLGGFLAGVRKGVKHFRHGSERVLKLREKMRSPSAN